MQLSQTTLDRLNNTFFKEHWQKNSVLFAQCFHNNDDFEQCIDINELAGLALEEDIESRLITQTNPSELKFNLNNGPFTEAQITSLPTSHWTLLIQAVDHYFEAFQALKQQFTFIPNWRLDDVMVSISPTGGTVGPHFDQYDVFLIQASGTREWQVGQTCDSATALMEGNALSIIDNFNAEQTHQCSVGDMLYIPPGKSHWGTATSDNCITISIGFRAPSYQELIDDISLEAISDLSESERFEDVHQTRPQQNLALIDDENMAQITKTLQQLILDKYRIGERFNAMSSQVKYPDDFDIITQEEAASLLSQWQQAQATLILRANSRINYSKHLTDHGETFIIGLNGQVIRLPASPSLEQLIEQLSTFQAIKINQINASESCLTLITAAISFDAVENLNDTAEECEY